MSLPRSLVQPLIKPVLKALVSTLRVTVVNPGLLRDPEQKGIIYAFWHGKMLYGWLLSRKLFPGKSVHAVVSRSRDGQILSATLSKLGFELIRGSSSRGGDEVKRTMLAELKKNRIVAVTPDGPRGPLHTFKYGTLRLASEHRIPVLFAEIAYAKAFMLKSWDRFEIPVPFSPVTVTLHMIDVPLFRDPDEVAVFERQLSKRFGDG